MRLKKIQNLVKGEFARNAITLTLGTSIAQILNFLIYPILSRLFSPSDFGIYATVSSITTILAVMGTGRYEKSVLIADSKNDAANIIGLALFIGLIVNLTILVIFLLFSKPIGLFFNAPYLEKWLFICPIGALSINIYNCYNEWCVRNKYFTNLSFNKITNSSAIALNKFLFGILKLSNYGLIIGDLFGRLITAIVSVYYSLKKDKNEFFQISIKKFKIQARKYIDFPKLFLPGEVINSITLALPIFFIGAYFSKNEVGLYSTAMSFLYLPISVIAYTIKDVFRQKANEEFKKSGNCIYSYIKLFKILMLSSIIGFALLFPILPGVFSFVLGNDWRPSGEFSQILLPMIVVEFIATPLNGVFIVTNQLRVIFYWQILFLVFTVLSLFIGIKVFNNITMCLLCYSIGRSFAFILDAVLSYKYAKGVK